MKQIFFVSYEHSEFHFEDFHYLISVLECNVLLKMNQGNKKPTKEASLRTKDEAPLRGTHQWIHTGGCEENNIPEGLLWTPNTTYLPHSPQQSPCPPH